MIDEVQIETHRTEGARAAGWQGARPRHSRATATGAERGQAVARAPECRRTPEAGH